MSSRQQTSQRVSLVQIPELYDANFLDILVPAVPVTAEIPKPVTASNPMMDALRADSKRILTENGAAALNTTDSPVLDAFLSLDGYKSTRKLEHHLATAWAEDAQLTLRLIWQLRSVHDGKSDKELFYRAFGWLYQNHPRTALQNLPYLVEPVCARPKGKPALPHGYWKDLLNVLVLELVGELRLVDVMDGDSGRPEAKFLHADRTPFRHGKPRKSKAQSEEERQTRIAASLQHTKAEHDRATQMRKEKGVEYEQLLATKLADPKFRALYIAVARLFADQLAKDMVILKRMEGLSTGSKEARRLSLQLSLAGKWAPSPGLSHDRRSNIAVAISQLLQHKTHCDPILAAALVFPQALSNIQDPVLAAHIHRSFFQRWVLTQLRKASAVPEVFMTAQQWNNIKYNRVPSVCMQNNVERFLTHDEERFCSFLLDVEKGKKSISGAALLPHTIVAEAISGPTILKKKKKGAIENERVEKMIKEFKSKAVDGQWNALLERLRESGSLDGALAVCDVSGSMGSLGYTNAKDPDPILPAIALSLLLAQLGKPPFANAFITFSASPEFVTLASEKSLVDNIWAMSGAAWGMNTNLRAVFLELILPLAVRNMIKQEDMIKRLFIFTDMQFDQGSTTRGSDQWDTVHDEIVKAYEKEGYQAPEIVYWDLSRGRENLTVQAGKDAKGVAMMNGFSPALLKVFMGEDEVDPEEAWEKLDEEGNGMQVDAKPKEEITPLAVMKKSLMRTSFDGLVVYD